MGKEARRLLLFAIRHMGWNSYGKDRKTVRAIKTLEDFGFLEVNRETRQFRLLTEKRKLLDETIKPDTGLDGWHHGYIDAFEQIFGKDS